MAVNVKNAENQFLKDNPLERYFYSHRISGIIHFGKQLLLK